MYQLMKVYSDGSIGASGRLTSKLKHVKRRLGKVDKGWIVDLNSNGRIIAARGFSRDALAAVKSVGIEVVA